MRGCTVTRSAGGARDAQVPTSSRTTGRRRTTRSVPIAAVSHGVIPEDFNAVMQTHDYIFVPTGERWPAISVDARIPPVALIGTSGAPILDADGRPKTMKASAWLDRNRPVEQITWAPGRPQVIRNQLITAGGWIQKPGCACFNLYKPPSIRPGDSRRAVQWLDHLHRVYPHDATHILRFLAHRVQRPHEKVNHALVLGGMQGIGKDSLLTPAKQAVGAWNVSDVTPSHLLGRFNSFTKSVILCVNEASDLGDIDRYVLYERTKIYTAAPPEVIRVDEKNLREYIVPNVCGVVITTNHKLDGLFVPADDRRHYIAWSDRTKDDFPADYWVKQHHWYEAEGNSHVAAFLAEYDLSAFDPKAPPPKTAAFWEMVDANRAPEDAELADALDRLGNPRVTTLAAVASVAERPFADWLRDRRNARQIPHRMEAAGYVAARNPDSKDHLWCVEGRRQVIYAQRELAPRDRHAAAQLFARGDR